MAIIFDEIQYADKLDREHISSQHNAIKNGILLAKLYMKKGYTDEEVFEVLNSKFDILDSNYNYNIKYLKIKKMIEQATQNPNMDSRSITFSSEELEFIHSLGDLKIEKALFSMMCITKFYNYSPIYFNNSELFRLADISYSSKENLRIFGYIIQNGIYSVDEREIRNNKKIKKIFYFINEKLEGMCGEPKIEISNYKNLVYYYLEYFKIGSFIRCSKCGCIDKRNSNSQIYCKECSKQETEENKRNWRNKNICSCEQ